MSEELEMDIMNFCTSIESACVDLKRRIIARHGVFEEEDNAETRLKEAVNALFWETKEGSKGPYQQTSKKATNNHVTFQELQNRLFVQTLAINGRKYTPEEKMSRR